MLIVSEKGENMKLEQSKIVQWVNPDGNKIIWLITDQTNKGVVIHSDGLAAVGSINDLHDVNGLEPFVGTVHLSSEAD